MAINLGVTGGVQSTNETKKTKKKGSVSGSVSSFLGEFDSSADEIGASSASSVSTTSAISGIDALLLAQSIGDVFEDNSKKQKAIEKGHDILDTLEDLRADILLGKVSKPKLIKFARDLRSAKYQGIDEELEQILKEIELRAEVELAKLSNGV